MLKTKKNIAACKKEVDARLPAADEVKKIELHGKLADANRALERVLRRIVRFISAAAVSPEAIVGSQIYRALALALRGTVPDSHRDYYLCRVSDMCS